MAIETYLVGKEYFNVSITVIPSKLARYFEPFHECLALVTLNSRTINKLSNWCLSYHVSIRRSEERFHRKIFCLCTSSYYCTGSISQIGKNFLVLEVIFYCKNEETNQSLITLQMKLANQNDDVVFSISLNWHLGHLKPWRIFNSYYKFTITIIKNSFHHTMER